MVDDDGCGVPHEHGDGDVPHFGLQGMRERANKIGAVLEFECGPRGGTKVSVSVAAGARAISVPVLAHDAETVT